MKLNYVKNILLDNGIFIFIKKALKNFIIFVVKCVDLDRYFEKIGGLL